MHLLFGSMRKNKNPTKNDLIDLFATLTRTALIFEHMNVLTIEILHTPIIHLMRILYTILYENALLKLWFDKFYITSSVVNNIWSFSCWIEKRK